VRTLALTNVVLAGLARVALADGWASDGCREGDTGCQTDDYGMTSCKCDSSDASGSRHAASVGTTLGLLGFVVYRLRRPRRKR